MIENARQDKRIQKAIIALRNTIFGYPLLRVSIEFDDIIPTACVTNKGELKFNKEWILSKTDDEIIGVVAHECLHLLKGDLWRHCEKRADGVYAMAIDITANDLLVSESYDMGLKKSSFVLPSDGLIPNHHTIELKFPKLKIEDIDKKYSELIYNEIYKVVPKTHISIPGNGGEGEGDESDGEGNSKNGKDKNGKGKDKVGQGQGKGKDKLDKGFDSHIIGSGTKEDKAKEKEWQQITRTATVIAKQRGLLSARMEEMFDDMFDEKLDWKSILYKYVEDTLIYNLTYAKPSKKSQALKVYMPSALRENIDVFFAIDTSGSMSSEELIRAKTEILGLAKAFDNIRIRIVECDAELQLDILVEDKNYDKIKKLMMKGRGGTEFKPVFDYVKTKYSETKLIVFFTDGYGEKVNESYVPYGCDVLWIITKGGSPDSIKGVGNYILMGE